MHTDDPAVSVDGTPEHPPDLRGNRRKLISGIAALVVLIGLLGYVVGRNYLRDRGRRAQDSSDFVQQERAAIRETKCAFAEIYSDGRIPAGPAIDVTDPIHPPRSTDRSTSRAGENESSNERRATSPPSRGSSRASDRNRSRSHTSAILANSSAQTAIQRWRDLANSALARPSVCRRLGITLFLFHRPGGMDAFRRIPLLPPAKPRSADRSTTAGSALLKQSTPPQPALSFAEEARLWDAIYGPGPLRPEETSELRAKLKRLNLGWFENIAAAELYRRAGMPDQAQSSLQRAHRSADAVVRVLAIEGALPVIGGILILGYIGAWVLGQRDMAKHVAVPADTAADPSGLAAFYSPPAASTAPLRPPGTRAAESEPRSPFSFNTRVVTFVVFFGSYLLFAWPLRSILPVAVRWSGHDALRMSLTVEVASYIPIVAITLFTLKRLGERELRRRMTWRETLGALGLWTTRPVGDVVTAVGVYSMTMPALYVAALISYILFRRFHTPVHPVESILLSTQDDWARALVLIQAVVAAPIVEELTFRGLLFEGMRQRWGFTVAAVSSAAVFALSHNTLPGGFLLLWTLGFVFAFVYHRRQSLVPNILMHALHNGLITVLSLAVFSS